LRAYVEHGLVPAADGGLELACTPEDEAQVYERGLDAHAFDVLGDVRCPVVVVRGDEEVPPATWAPAVAAALPHGREHVLAGVQHFGPLQDPDAVAADVAAALGPWRDGGEGPETL